LNENHIAIKTENLTRKFRDLVAVDHLILEVERGETFGLVGPDGAGKTTTIRMLCAIMDPTEGRARVAGFDTVAEAEQIKRRIGYMAQRFNLYGDLSAWENLNFFADVFEVRGAERAERIERLLNFARLAEFRDRRAAKLSGGMQKKLALACTLIHEPELLLLDEPTTGVDPVSRREFWDILSELHLGGTTILVSTPYMDEADRCSRVGLMFKGQMVICDAPANIRARIPGEVVEVRLESWQEARTTLEGMPGVLEIQTYGESLHILVDSADQRLAEIQDALDSQAVDYRSLRRASARMEEAFISLIRGLEG